MCARAANRIPELWSIYFYGFCFEPYNRSSNADETGSLLGRLFPHNVLIHDWEVFSLQNDADIDFNLDVLDKQLHVKFYCLWESLDPSTSEVSPQQIIRSISISMASQPKSTPK